MIIRLFTFMAFVFIACGCHAERRESSATKSDNLASNEVQVAVELFSKSVSEKDVQLFIKLADPNGIHLVRKFTSGNLGGRGSELSALTDPQKMDSKFQFPVDNQTSYNIHIQFQGLPITSFNILPRRQLLPDADTTDFDQWETILKNSLKGAPEVVEGDSLLLMSEKYWVYTEAQIIDDVLVGGFAVFAKKDGKLTLVSLIELL